MGWSDPHKVHGRLHPSMEHRSAFLSGSLPSSWFILCFKLGFQYNSKKEITRMFDLSLQHMCLSTRTYLQLLPVLLWHGIPSDFPFSGFFHLEKTYATVTWILASRFETDTTQPVLALLSDLIIELGRVTKLAAPGSFWKSRSFGTIGRFLESSSGIT